MYRPLAAALVMFATLQAVTINTAENHDKILAAVDTRDHGAVVAELIDLEKRDPKSFVSNEYDYLLARAAEADGDLALAMVNYQRVVSRGSILAPYGLMHLSEAARSTGNSLLERLFLGQLIVFHPHSVLAAGATNRLARSSFESENYSETIRILTSPDSTAKKGSNEAARRGLALLGEAYMRSGVPDKAREIFAGLIDKMPDPAQPDDAAMVAAGGLDELDGAGKTVISEAEHIRRAGIYQSNRDFARAKLHYEAVIANDQKGQNAADAAFQIGRGLAQQANFVEASQWFERILEQFPAQPAARDALLQAASAYARVGKPKEAIKRYQRFIEAYPADEKLDRAYLNIVDVFRDQAEDSEALKWCAKTRDAFPGKLPATLALFDEVRIYITHDDWPAALTGLERLATVGDLGGTSVPGGTNAAEVTFLKAFALEQMGRFAEAIDTYLSIPDGRAEYYGWRATDRLKALANIDSARGFILQKLGASLAGLKAKDAETRMRSAQAALRLTDSADVRDQALGALKASVKAVPRYQNAPNPKPGTSRPKTGTDNGIASKLLSLGLYDEAAPEIEISGKGVSGDGAYTLADLYRRGDRGDRAVAFTEPLWKKMPADYPIELIPRGQLALLYPAPYADTITRVAGERGVDPRFVLAIMRQESRFQPDASSVAAAGGLMQLLPETAQKTAGELGRNYFDRDDLYYPPTSILFGTQYIADLFKRFPGRAEAVAASYNGGPDNMERWLARSESGSADRYVPEIVYAQSKDYVYKVMANYRMYQYLYDEELRAR